jgi:hypothetical protein
MRPNLACPAEKPERWEDQDVTLQLWYRVLAGSCLNEAGGGCKSRSMRLWDGFEEERRVAVARPMPDEEPVIKIVFGVDFRVDRDSVVGMKRDMSEELVIVVSWGCAADEVDVFKVFGSGYVEICRGK